MALICTCGHSSLQWNPFPESPEARCKRLLEMLQIEFKKNNLSEIEHLFNTQGRDFLESNTPEKSILESVLETLGDYLSDDTLSYLIYYYVNHSREAYKARMTPLGFLIKIYPFLRSKPIRLLTHFLHTNPLWLNNKMTLQIDYTPVEVTPIELALYTHYKSSAIELMFSIYQDYFPITFEYQQQLLKVIQQEWIESRSFTKYRCGWVLGNKVKKLLAIETDERPMIDRTTQIAQSVYSKQFSLDSGSFHSMSEHTVTFAEQDPQCVITNTSSQRHSAFLKLLQCSHHATNPTLSSSNANSGIHHNNT